MKPLLACAGALSVLSLSVFGSAPLLAGDADQPNLARSGALVAVQISTTDPQTLLTTWGQTTPGVQLETQKTATRNQPIYTFIVFAGCKPDAAGACHLIARFEVFDPKGKSYAVHDGAVLLDGPPPPPGNFGLGTSSLGMRIEDGEPLGQYRMVVKTTDTVAGTSVTTRDTLTITEAPITGGWQAIANPNSSAELRPVVKAVLGMLPRKNPRVAKIESAQSQVVAGTNYRVVLRLKDGTRWSATVWHKLDGSYAVSNVAQLR